jgi:hypothetical protein
MEYRLTGSIAATYTPLPVYAGIKGCLFAAIGIATCFGVGCGASLLLPGESRMLEGLTIRTMRRQ